MDSFDCDLQSQIRLTASPLVSRLPSNGTSTATVRQWPSKLEGLTQSGWEYYTLLLLAIGHLWGIEEVTANPYVQPAVPHRTATGPVDPQVCEGCQESGHHFTEILKHLYVWNLAANTRLLKPGEHLSGPANWQDIHRASLHHLICTVLQYHYYGNATVVVLKLSPYHEGHRLIKNAFFSTTYIDGVPNHFSVSCFWY
jgi:hypothetical protein